MLPSMNTKGRNIRISDDLWSQAKAIAAARDETLTQVVTEALRRYVRRHQP
jgi:predicted transcriptional regulator